MKLQAILIISSLVLLIGCVSESRIITRPANMFSISGVEEYLEVNGTDIILEVSGINNHVKVSEGSTVSTIVLSGADNVVELPQGLDPVVTKTGVRNTIEYY